MGDYQRLVWTSASMYVTYYPPLQPSLQTRLLTARRHLTIELDKPCFYPRRVVTENPTICVKWGFGVLVSSDTHAAVTSYLIYRSSAIPGNPTLANSVFQPRLLTYSHSSYPPLHVHRIGKKETSNSYSRYRVEGIL